MLIKLYIHCPGVTIHHPWFFRLSGTSLGTNIPTVHNKSPGIVPGDFRVGQGNQTWLFVHTITSVGDSCYPFTDRLRLTAPWVSERGAINHQRGDKGGNKGGNEGRD